MKNFLHIIWPTILPGRNWWGRIPLGPKKKESGGWKVEGEEVWSVQESGSEKIIKNLSSVAKFFFQNFIRFCQFFTTKKFLGLKLLPPEKYMINPMFFNHKKVKIKDGLHRL